MKQVTRLVLVQNDRFYSDKLVIVFSVYELEKFHLRLSQKLVDAETSKPVAVSV